MKVWADLIQFHGSTNKRVSFGRLSLGAWHSELCSQPVQYWELTDTRVVWGVPSATWEVLAPRSSAWLWSFAAAMYAMLSSHQLPQLQWGCRSFLVWHYQEEVFTFVVHIFVGHCGHFKILSLGLDGYVIFRFSTTLGWLQPHTCRPALLLRWAHQDEPDAISLKNQTN